ncbi:hypothetical protein BDY19DRAFT_995170 [Irpex rosettiformis]|uniref:Uncharacterized protein n=1 Tax=Irpex rosettiformis TaxID=378272 RepID=A0ACB8TYD9_9APHY|nr:hypothetical protein BDY19DRAFT_995170 [Irpex rosettiformis]
MSHIAQDKMHSVKRRVKDYAKQLFPPLQYKDDCEPSRSTFGSRDTLQVSRSSSEVNEITRGLHNLGPLSSAEGNLPTELLLQTFAYMLLRDILRCREVCRRFKDIIDGSPEMQYIIELYVSGYRDNEANTSMDVLARFEALKVRQNWWKFPCNYRWKRVCIGLSHVRIDRRNHQFSDNLWLIHSRNSSLLDVDEVPSFRSNVVNCICFEETVEDSPVVESWTLSFSFLFDACVADSSRGVLYLVRLSNEQNRRCYRVRTVSIEDGFILRDKIFEGTEEDEEIPWVLDPCMFYLDDILACTTWVDGIIGIHPSLVDIAFLDLKSGEIVAGYSKVVTASAELSFQFLTKDVYLLHTMEGGRFYTEVYKLEPSLSQRKFTVHLVAAFEYPTVRHKAAKHWHFTIGPNQLEGSRLGRTTPPPPFIRSKEVPLVVIHRCFVNTDIVHYVQASVFTSIAEHFIPSDRPPTIAWKSWGPTNSRCFLNTGFGYTARCFGGKVLLNDLTLLDFNQLDIFRDLQRADKSYIRLGVDTSPPQSHFSRLFHRGESGNLAVRMAQDSGDIYIPGTLFHIVTDPTVIPKGRIFDEDVVTMLPYRESRLERNGHVAFQFWGETCVVCTEEDGKIVCNVPDKRKL